MSDLLHPVKRNSIAFIANLCLLLSTHSVSCLSLVIPCNWIFVASVEDPLIPWIKRHYDGLLPSLDDDGCLGDGIGIIIYGLIY